MLLDRSSGDQQTENRKSERMKELKRKVENLKCLREQLQREISSVPSVTFHTLLLDRQPTAATCTLLPTQHEFIEKASTLVKTRQLESKMAAYRYGGITVRRIDQLNVIVGFGTSYKGEYFETYYVQMTLDQRITVQSSTLPFFIPLTSLLDRLNKQEIRLSNLLETVHSYLLAYVARREQANEVMSNLSHLLSDTLLLQLPYTFLQISLRLPTTAGQSDDVTIQLTYEHLHSTLPSKVQCSRSPLQISQATIENLFLSQPLPDALVAVEKIAKTD